MNCAIKADSEAKESPIQLVRGYFGRLFGSSSAEVGTSYTYSGTFRDDKIFINLDPGRCRYRIRITVTDEIAGIERVKSVPVTIVGVTEGAE